MTRRLRRWRRKSVASSQLSVVSCQLSVVSSQVCCHPERSMSLGTHGWTKNLYSLSSRATSWVAVATGRGVEGPLFRWRVILPTHSIGCSTDNWLLATDYWIMPKKLDHTAALEHLARADRRLARIIVRSGECRLQQETTQSIFEALLESIRSE